MKGNFPETYHLLSPLERGGEIELQPPPQTGEKSGGGDRLAAVGENGSATKVGVEGTARLWTGPLWVYSVLGRINEYDI